ncbi:DUF5106 domain-containing protein [Bacteroides sp.]|uniref:DUF5106 domain-containing protein n=1 Tax=Bacteroides sp. TaxID=29523 RepID=UPI0026059266|nr:DUF5106 domain-containing protein [Bacteroides sp.]
MNNKLFSLLLPLCLCTACGNSKANSVSKADVPTDTITVFTLPAIPPMLNTPELRADFLVRHYWENINFADTNYVHHPEITEQAWVDYIDILKIVPAKTADVAIKDVFTQAEKAKTSYLYLAELADKYLYDPNSPMRNEELYISVLDALIASPILDETEKIRPQGRRELAQKNRVGTKAIDFTYTLASGKKSTLYALNVPYTLLFINNPGCHACSETIEALKNAPAINRAISQKQLQILSLYPDEELDEWRKHISDFPADWTNGYDAQQTISKNNLYDLKAIPTLYLLDKDKIVLLKDATAMEIDKYLN